MHFFLTPTYSNPDIHLDDLCALVNRLSLASSGDEGRVVVGVAKGWRPLYFWSSRCVIRFCGFRFQTFLLVLCSRYECFVRVSTEGLAAMYAAEHHQSSTF